MKKEQADKMSVQGLCDYAVAKIVEQGERCVDHNGHCMYSDGKGNHCALGWLLDEDDSELMDAASGAEGLIQDLPEKIPQIIKDNEYTFSLLQRFHDEFSPEKRPATAQTLSKYIDISAPQYQQWIDMGGSNETN